MSDYSRGTPVTAEPAPQTIVVALPAEIDISNCVIVEAALAAALAESPEVVIADGTSTSFCDCAAISTLIRAHQQAAAAGAQLRVVVTGVQVHRVLDLTGAGHVLLVYPSLGVAQAECARHAPPPLPADSADQAPKEARTPAR